MANYFRHQPYRARRNQKENVGPIKNTHNLGSIISDKEALRIHGLNFESNGYSTESDSGKSDFDEEYYKHKPQPLPINRRKVVTIKRLNTRNEQPQIKTSNLLKTEIQKDFSNLTSGKSGTSSTLFKNKFNEVVATDQPNYKNIETVNPYIRPTLNTFPVNENNFSSLKDITCQPSTANNLTLKRPLKTGIVTKNEDTAKNLTETQLSSLPVISNEPAFHSLYLQMQKVLSDDRSIRPMQTLNSAQTLTESKIRTSLITNNHEEQKNQFQMPRTSGETTIENNFPNMKNITCQPSPANVLTLKRPSKSGIADTLKRNEDTAKNLSEAQRQSSRPVISNEAIFHSYLVKQKVLSTESKMRTSLRANNQEELRKNQFHEVSTPSGETNSRTNTIPTHKPQNSSSAASNYDSLTLNVSNLPDVLPKVSDSSRSMRKSLPSNNARNPVPPHIVTNTFRAQNENLPNRNFSWSPHGDIFAGESRNTVEENADTGESSESAGLCGETSGSFCGRCIDFLLCRRC